METLACSLPPAVELRCCRHCSSALPSRSASEFCCQGCETVFSLLQASGLSRYYSILERTGQKARAVEDQPSSSPREYQWLDRPEIRAEYETSGQMFFYLEGVHCAACVWLVEKLPQWVPGVESARLDLGNAVVSVRLAAHGRYSAAAEGLLQIGYRPHPVRAQEASEHSRLEERRLLTQLGVAAGCAGNIMLLAIAGYAGADGLFATSFSALSFILSLPVMTYSAAPFYRSAWIALRARQLSIDVPVVLGLLTSFFVSVWNLAHGDGRIYFDSITALVFLLLASRYLLKRIQRSALSASSLAHFLMPAFARRILPDGTREEISLSALRVDDRVEVYSGEIFPADGVVLEGRSEMNLSVLTGESVPKAISVGSSVFGGALNVGSSLRVGVTHAGNDARVGRILESLRLSANARARIDRFSDRISRGFIAATLVLLPLVFLGNSRSGWDEAFQRALALALVTCPCAFALATPLTFASVLAKLGRAGILIKSSETLERLAEIQNVFFDKTGTLTRGRFEVLEWKLLQEGRSIEQIAALIVALEKGSRHPLAEALRDFFTPLARGASPMALAFHRERLGSGVEAEYDGRKFRIGSALQADQADVLKSSATQQELVTRLVLFENEKPLAVMSLGDQMRPEAHRVIQQIRDQGLVVRLISGDSPLAVAHAAESLQIPRENLRAEVSPEDKAEALSKTPSSMMVGDGVNDALALTSASVGIAVRGGLEASVRASDVYLSRRGISQIPQLVIMGRETLRIIKRNFLISLIYNLVAAVAAVSGMITPLLAAVLMPMSAFAVFTSAILGTSRLRRALQEVSR
ncbi:MAG: hypothetical protein RJB38_470 [Pseudomonadota bacterium]|jgi:Cu2+-exporting ATPase/Cu+-exporting ATPase